METILKGTGIGIAIFGVVGTIYMTATVTSNGATTFIAGIVSTYLVSLLFIALGNIIKNQYAADSNAAANIEELEKKITNQK